MAANVPLPPPLPDLEVLSPLVTRVLAQNPGPYTLTGTNCYIVGSGESRLLIDAGEGNRPGFLDLLQQAMTKIGCKRLSKLVLTHYHHDHVGGVSEVLQRFSEQPIEGEEGYKKMSKMEVLKFPLPEVASSSIIADDRDAGFHDSGEAGGSAFTPLADGDLVQVEGATLTVIHTPGHTSDHICLALNEEQAIFSADCVMGFGTAVFAELHTYMASLERLIHAGNSMIGGEKTTEQKKKVMIFPSHGPVIDDGIARISDYIMHRNMREKQIVEYMEARKTRGEKGPTVMEIVKMIYTTTPESLYPAAANNVILHLRKLETDGCVVKAEVDGASGEQRWYLIATSGLQVDASVKL